MKKIIKRIFIICCSIFLFVVIGCLGINLYMINYAKSFTYTNVSDLPEKYTVIVPGGKVYSNSVSHVVRDRIQAASECIENGKAQRVLLSGDHGQTNYDEVNQMKNFMTKNYGTDENIIFMDHAGFSTYETMYRARDIFCVNDAVVVTQKFHTARSVYIARKLGLDVVAYEAPVVTRFSEKTLLLWDVRETLARVKSFFLVAFHAKPTYLGEQIPITGDAKLSWD